jgi:eukaryotic-like serine/threonine-protein kinase
VEQESSKPAGTVIDQNPKAGKSVDRDTRIELTLATAPPPPPPPTTQSPTETPTTTPTTTPTATAQGNRGEADRPR